MESRVLRTFLLTLGFLACSIRGADGMNKIQIANEAKKGLGIDGS
jgi:hypothetical protein